MIGAPGPVEDFCSRRLGVRLSTGSEAGTTYTKVLINSMLKCWTIGSDDMINLYIFFRQQWKAEFLFITYATAIRRIAVVLPPSPVVAPMPH